MRESPATPLQGYTSRPLYRLLRQILEALQFSTELFNKGLRLKCGKDPFLHERVTYHA